LLADMLGGWEIVLILAVVLILFGAQQLPGLGRGLSLGFREFRKATEESSEELDLNPKESGLVCEALTHDNRTAEFLYPHNPHLAELLRAMILLLAQGFGIGRIPIAPGTFGSLLGLVWFAALLATGRYELYLLGALGGVGLSVWLCGAAERILKQKDPPSVVLDEMVAVPFCFLPWVTHVWWLQHKLPAIQTFFTARALLATSGIFVLFRLFDIAKPWPVKQSQGLPGGWGVTVDDLLAAGYVALAVAGAAALGWLH
jgi:phosphatidylglycerophosphatase A